MGLLMALFQLLLQGFVLIAINKLLNKFIKRNGLIIMFYKKELKRLFSLQSFSNYMW